MIGMLEKLEETVAFVRQRTALRPTVGVILGSGLGQLVERMEDATAIDYCDVPHFPAPTVAGHAGRMVFGRIGKVDVVAMQGRFHYYEGHDMRTVAYPTAFMKQFGVRTLVVSNSAGGINRDFTPGDLMLITDHINLFATNPLIGLNDERLGPRFPDMTEAYDADLRRQLHAAAALSGRDLRQGVYLAVSGPSFETPAEIRAFRTLGADAVGMSTVPEVIVARHEGMRVVAISCLCNMAAGILPQPLTHTEVLEAGDAVAEGFEALIRSFLRRLAL